MYIQITRGCLVGGRARYVDDVFRVHQEDFDILTGMGKAIPAPEDKIKHLEEMDQIAVFAGKYVGQTAAILGGGPSLPDDIKGLPKAVLFGINYHAPRIVDCDYLVFNDRKTPHGRPMKEAMAEYPGVKLSRHLHQSDYDLTYLCDPGMSSIQAVFAADLMGFDEIILCGMGCYQDGLYFHKTEEKPLVSETLHRQIKRWRLCFEKCEHPERIKAMSGPLTQVFGRYGD